jgi:hypothetical protein
MANSRKRAHATGQLGSPVAVASFEALRVLIWQLCFFGAVPGPLLERELKRAARDVSPVARELLEMLAAVAQTGVRDWDKIPKPEP